MRAACTSSTTTSSRARCAPSRRATSASSASGSWRATAASASAPSPPSRACRGRRLERDGFKLRLTEVQRGSLNVVLQPGLWRVPRIDHIGVVMDDEDDYNAVLERAASWNLPVQDRSSRRTFVSTGAGYRLEVHPPRPWIDDLLAERDELALADLRLRTSEPHQKASALADLLGLDEPRGGAVERRRRRACSSSRTGPRAGPSSTPSASRRSGAGEPRSRAPAPSELRACRQSKSARRPRGGAT